mgnify:CR=1 FL=1
MKRSLLLAAALLASAATAPAARAQSNFYEWSAAINLGFGILNQMMGIQRQFQQPAYGYGGQGFGMAGPPGWHLRGQQQGWGAQPGWGQQCQPQLMQNQMGQRAIVDPCTGQVLQWVR